MIHRGFRNVKIVFTTPLLCGHKLPATKLNIYHIYRIYQGDGKKMVISHEGWA
jgi:hypothetical protein